MSFTDLVEYTASLFKVLFVSSPVLKGAYSNTMSTDELAHDTVVQVFKEAGLGSSAKLDKAAFTSFVNRGIGL